MIVFMCLMMARITCGRGKSECNARKRSLWNVTKNTRKNNRIPNSLHLFDCDTYPSNDRVGLEYCHGPRKAEVMPTHMEEGDGYKKEGYRVLRDCKDCEFDSKRSLGSVFCSSFKRWMRCPNNHSCPRWQLREGWPLDRQVVPGPEAAR